MLGALGWLGPRTIPSLIRAGKKQLERRDADACGIDYDGTYTAAPRAWSAAVAKVRDACVRVSMVTARDDRYDRNDEIDMLAESGTAVHYTRKFAKAMWMTHIAEDPVDI